MRDTVIIELFLTIAHILCQFSFLSLTTSAYQHSGDIPQCGYKELLRGMAADLSVGGI